MSLLKSNVGAACFAILTITTSCWASQNIQRTTRVDYGRVNGLVAPSDYVSALGISHVKPTTLPEPLPGYEKSHRSINVGCIAPFSEVDTRETMISRARAGTRVEINQTDMDYDPVSLDAKVADHHIAQWLINRPRGQGSSK